MWHYKRGLKFKYLSVVGTTFGDPSRRITFATKYPGDSFEFRLLTNSQ